MKYRIKKVGSQNKETRIYEHDIIELEPFEEKETRVSEKALEGMVHIDKVLEVFDVWHNISFQYKERETFLEGLRKALSKLGEK